MPKSAKLFGGRYTLQLPANVKALYHFSFTPPPYLPPLTSPSYSILFGFCLAFGLRPGCGEIRDDSCYRYASLITCQLIAPVSLLPNAEA